MVPQKTVNRTTSWSWDGTSPKQSFWGHEFPSKLTALWPESCSTMLLPCSGCPDDHGKSSCPPYCASERLDWIESKDISMQWLSVPNQLAMTGGILDSHVQQIPYWNRWSFLTTLESDEIHAITIPSYTYDLDRDAISLVAWAHYQNHPRLKTSVLCVHRCYPWTN